VDDDRWVRVLLALGFSDGSAAPKLCAMSAQVLAVSGAGVTVMASDGASRMTVCSSNDIALKIEDLQFSLGEGPCDDAYARGRPVGEPDLAASDPARWPRFSAAALEAGAAAVFGFPLCVGGSPIGAIGLYRDTPGALSANQFADALVVADVVAREILTLQSKAARDSGPAGLDDDTELRLVVYQATGMVAAQLDVDMSAALVRLRARAYAEGIPLTQVATEVVNRERRFS
jgi:hypothetical protein